MLNQLSYDIVSTGIIMKYIYGTLIYMAPEMAFKHEYTKSVDIWAVGIIMHLLLTGGKHPFYVRD